MNIWPQSLLVLDAYRSPIDSIVLLKKKKKKEGRKSRTQFVMTPGRIASQLHVLKEGDSASHRADGVRSSHLSRVTEDPVQRSWSCDGVCGLGQDIQQHRLHGPPGEPLRPPRWSPGWRDSPRGSGAEDASGRVWERLAHGWEKGKKCHFSAVD